MPGPVTTPAPVPASATRSLKLVGAGVVVGGVEGGVVTVIARAHDALRLPLVTVTVASYTPGARNVWLGLGLADDPPSRKSHENW